MNWLRNEFEIARRRIVDRLHEEYGTIPYRPAFKLENNTRSCATCYRITIAQNELSALRANHERTHQANR